MVAHVETQRVLDAWIEKVDYPSLIPAVAAGPGGNLIFSGDEKSFAALPPPEDEEVEGLLLKVAKKALKLARARYPDGLPHAEDAKAALAAASVQVGVSGSLRLPQGVV